MLCFQVFVATHPRRSPDFFFGLSRCPTSSHSPYTLPSSVCPKSCICHSCENCRGVYQQFPFRNSQLFFLPSTNLDAGVGRSFRTVHRACPELLGVNSHSSFKSFSRNAYGSPRKCCKQKTYDPTKPFRCNTYKKQGVGAPPFRNSSLITRHSSLATAVKFFAFTLLRTLLHFSALAQNSTRFFPIASALFVQKHGGVGYALHPYFVTSLLHYRQKRQRPSRSDGGSCEKGAPSSGEKIVSSVKSVVGRRRRRRVWLPERVN